MPSNYEVEFKRAEFTFLYQLVFDPRTQQQVRLNALPEGVDPSEFEFAGMYPYVELQDVILYYGLLAFFFFFLP